MVFEAGPDNLPISTIFPSLTPTSPRNDGIPEPSTIRPFLISRSYAIGVPPQSHCARYHLLLRTIAHPRTARRAKCARGGNAEGPGPRSGAVSLARARDIGLVT